MTGRERALFRCRPTSMAGFELICSSVSATVLFRRQSIPRFAINSPRGCAVCVRPRSALWFGTYFAPPATRLQRTHQTYLIWWCIGLPVLLITEPELRTAALPFRLLAV